MKSNLFILVFSLFVVCSSSGQSLEFMGGHNLFFFDVQWLKQLESHHKFSLFSRTRATVSFENQTDIFSGAYFNYTGKHGIGVSLVGKVGRQAAGGDVGFHYFKANPTWMIFGLATVSIKNQLEYSWFSIARFTPRINEKWGVYTSLELFSHFLENQHLYSVQRIRAGVSYRKIQFGVGLDFTQFNANNEAHSNLGIFVRKPF